MTTPSFVDTNILLYSISTLSSEQAKRERALDILSAPDLVLSVQVLQEFYVQATRPSRRGRVSHELALRFIRDWGRFPVLDVSLALFHRALALRAQYQLSYWDCAIIAAAEASGCRELFTEDLQHGAVIAGARIRNPFL